MFFPESEPATAYRFIESLLRSSMPAEEKLQELFREWSRLTPRHRILDTSQFDWSTASIVRWLDTIESERAWERAAFAIRSWFIEIAEFVLADGSTQCGLEIAGEPWLDPQDVKESAPFFRPVQYKSCPAFLTQIIAKAREFDDSAEINFAEYLLGMGSTAVLAQTVMRERIWKMLDGRQLYVGWSDGDLIQVPL